MATLDELQKQKPLIDRVLDFLSKNLRLLCILLGISCVLLGGFMWRGLKLQEWMFCLALLFFYNKSLFGMVGKTRERYSGIYKYLSWDYDVWLNSDFCSPLCRR